MGRLLWPDIAKGIGIITVPIGHIYRDTLVGQTIFLFHMPLFFFISGFFFKSDSNLWKFCKEKALHLLIPYTFILILFSYPEAFANIDANAPLITYVRKVGRLLIGGQYLNTYLNVVWFITCLFLVQNLYNFIRVYFQEKWIHITAFLMLLLGYILEIYVPDFWLPLGANAILGALPILHAGYLYKTYKDKFNVKLVSIVGILAVGSATYIHSNYIDMKAGYYGIPFLTLMLSFSVILSIIALSEKLSTIKIFSVPLAEIGQASLVIMYFSEPVQLFIGKFYTQNQLIRTLAAIFIPFILYILFRKVRWTRAFILGSKPDLQSYFTKAELK